MTQMTKDCELGFRDIPYSKQRTKYYNQGQKFRNFLPKNRRKIVFRSASKRKSHGKLDWKKNRPKIGFIGDFSEKNRKSPIFLWKNRKSPIFLWKNRTSAARAGRRVDGANFRRIFGEKLVLSPIYRRFIGRFFGKSWLLRLLVTFDPTVQICSAFFLKSNGYIFYPTVDFKSKA